MPAARATPGSRSEVPVHLRLALRAGAFVYSLYSRFLGWSSRFEVRGRENLEAAIASGRPVVVTFWHDQVLGVISCRLYLAFPRLLAMVSRSRDGELAAALVAAHGMETVRASTSRGAVPGLLRMARTMRDPKIPGGSVWCVLAMDAPRGPRHRAHAGYQLLARRAGALILPMTLGMSRRKTFNSWDRLRLPLPFGRMVLSFGEPIDAAPGPGGKDSLKGEPPPYDPELRRGVPTTDQIERIMTDLAAGDPLCARDWAPE